MARKQTSKMSRAVSQLEHIFNKMNDDFFEGKLPVPVITVQSKPGTYGHFTTAKVWKKKDGESYELNIAAEMLSCPIEETLDTMLHEMVHLYCKENGIQDVSRGGKYHNGKFKEQAERVGLECFKTEKYGWNTKAGDKMIEYALSNDWTEITMKRKMVWQLQIGNGAASGQAPVAVSGGKAPSSTRKYICPCCGNSVRATKDLNIICGDCMQQMVKA